MAGMDTRKLLEAIGGQAVIARECEVTDSAVSQWVKADQIPKAHLRYLRLTHPGPHWDDYDGRPRRATAEQHAPQGA